MKWTLENVKVTAQKYSSKSEFAKNDFATYQYARRKGWLDEVTKHMVDKRKYTGKAKKIAKEAAIKFFEKFSDSLIEKQIYLTELKQVKQLTIQSLRDEMIQKAKELGISPNEYLNQKSYLILEIVKDTLKNMVDLEKSPLYTLSENLKEYIRKGEFIPESEFGATKKDMVDYYRDTLIWAISQFPEYPKIFGNRPIFFAKGAWRETPDFDFSFVYDQIPDLNFKIVKSLKSR